MEKTIILILCLFILSFCINTDSDFPSTFKLDRCLNNFENHDFIRVEKCFFSDTLLILLDGKGDTAFHVYTTSFRKLFSFGVKGKGKNEIDNVDYTFLEPKSKTLYVIEAGTRKILCFPLDSVLKNHTYYAETPYRLPCEFEWIKGFGFVNDSTFLLGATHGRSVILKYQNNRIIDSLGQLPAKSQNYERDFWYYLQYQYIVEYNPVVRKIVARYVYYDKIEIFDLDNWEQVATVKAGDDITPPLFPNGMINTNQVKAAYHGGLVLTDRYIFAAYNGQKLLEKLEHPSGLTKMITTTPQEIHVFDYSGKKICRILLGDYFGEFLVDEINKRFIVFGFHKDLSDCFFKVFPMTDDLIKTLKL